MENNIYTHDKKKKLADRISKIKKKEHMIKIFEIIYKENKSITENNNGIFMFFHTLSDETYKKIEDYLKQIEKNKIDNKSKIVNSETYPIKKKEYQPYAQDEIVSQEDIIPKLKFSNKEKNIIKRRKYYKTINSENNSNIIYKQFDVSTLTDTDTENIYK